MKIPLMAFAILALSTSSAFSNCYEIIGCTNSDHFATSDLENLSCQTLWEVRNQIYHENGYCFQSERAAATFSNDSCSISHAADVTLNNHERSNIERIKSVEKSRGC